MKEAFAYGKPDGRGPAGEPGGWPAVMITVSRSPVGLVSRLATIQARTPVIASGGGLPGDQIELVAFDIGERRPAGLVSLQVAQPEGAQAQQALGVSVEGLADEIEMQAVLDGLRLWDLVEG